MKQREFPDELIERCCKAAAAKYRESSEVTTGDMMRATLAEAFAWQPMETALKDGSELLMSCPTQEWDRCPGFWAHIGTRVGWWSRMPQVSGAADGGWETDPQPIEPIGWTYLPTAQKARHG